MNSEIKTWCMLTLAVISGSFAATSMSGCRKPTDPAGVSSNTTADDSNVTAADSNVTAAETPIAAADDNEATAEMQLKAVDTPVAAKPAAAEVKEAPVAEVKEAPAAEPKEAPVAEAKEEPAAMVAAAPKATKTAAAPAGKSDDPAAVLEAGGDWPQWAGTRLRNNTPNVKGIAKSWNIGKFDRRTGEWDGTNAENIKWFAKLGSQTYGNPVVAGGRVFCGTNNSGGYLKRYPGDVDLGCLICFDEETGEFLWQHSSEKLITGRVHDWPLQGICCAPLVEGDRLWFVTSRGEVRCLDTKGFHDGSDDGEVKGERGRVADLPVAKPEFKEAVAGLDKGELTEALLDLLTEHGEPIEGTAEVTTVAAGKKWSIKATIDGVARDLEAVVAGPRLSVFKTITADDKEEADVLWVYNMMEELGISQHNMCSCSVTSYGDLLFVNTSNGVDESHIVLPSPDAPSFICMNKNTGEVLWTDKSPGTNIVHGQWSSPTVAELGGVVQAIFAGGDGWVYSFKADQGGDGNPELLWKFDANPKTSKWILGGAGTRNNIIATPVVHDGLVYVAVGQDPEHGEGQGHLWCIDPTKRGDISSELAMKIEGDKRVPIPHRRLQAVIEEDGEVAIDNPNSGVVWHYASFDQNGDGEIDFEEEMHRSCGTVAIQDDLLYVADFSGMLHCLDPKGSENGEPIVHFTYDMLAQAWGSPLIADGHVYIGDEDGDVAIFELGKDNKEPIDEINMGTSVYSTPIAANGVIYISTKDKLFAIAPPKE